ncbi:hypothetical protein D3C71_1665460 [compost metagenome]
MVDTRADHLIFMSFDLDNLRGEVVYNGPEDIAIKVLPAGWTGQMTISMTRIRLLDLSVPDEHRLGAH